ncbi:autophagy-related protein 11, putative [Plasmodium vinckei lentum]|uniref:Autophagy-related protein 11, putative n=1 Tax=Plasmodium vinckei lentum TaxID=138297 RepID=A0A6V7RW48_PLAVN|nr:autophagy-related protein 11, putative [Plasmodium vinckei lentum]
MINLKEDEKDPYKTYKNESEAPFERKNFDDLKKSIENLLNDEQTTSELDNIKKSLLELELSTQNNNESNSALNKESLICLDDGKTFEEIKKELEKQKRMNNSLSLKIKSIHIKLNNIYMKRNEVEKSITDKIRQIEIKFSALNQGSKEEDDTADTRNDGDCLELKGNEYFETSEKTEIEKLKKVLNEYEEDLKCLKNDKEKKCYELRCSKKDLEEEIKKNHEYTNKIKCYEMDANIYKNDNLKKLQEINEIKIELENLRNIYNDTYVKNKLLSNEKNELTLINNDLKLKLKNVKTDLETSKNKENILNKCTNKIHNILIYLKKNNDKNFEYETFENKLDKTNDKLLINADKDIDEIYSSIQNLINMKKYYEEKKQELEETKNEIEVVKNNFMERCKSYEEMKMKMEKLKLLEKDNLKICNDKKNDEKRISELKEKLTKEENKIIELKKKNYYNVFKLKDFKEKEQDMIDEIKKLRKHIKEYKICFEKSRKINKNQLKYMKGKNKRLLNNIHGINFELKKCVSKINQINKNTESLKREKENVQKEIYFIKKKNEKLQQELKEIEVEKKNKESKAQELNSNIYKVCTELNKQNKEYKENIKRLCCCRDELKEALKKKSCKFILLKKNCYYLKKKIQKQNNELKKHLNIIKKQELAISNCSEQNEKLSEELKRHDLLIKSRDNKIKILENNLIKNEEINHIQIKENANVIKHGEMELKNINEQREKLQEQNKKLNELVDDLKSQLIKEEIKNTEMNKNIYTIKNELKNAREQIEKEYDLHTQEDKKILNSKVEKMNNEINELNKVKSSYEVEIKKLNGDWDKLNLQLKEKESENEKLASSLKEQENVIQNLRNKIKEIEGCGKLELEKKEYEIMIKKMEDENERQKEEITQKSNQDKIEFEEKIKSIQEHNKVIIEELKKKWKKDKENYEEKIKNINEKNNSIIEKIQEDCKSQIKRVTDLCNVKTKSEIDRLNNDEQLQKQIKEYSIMLNNKDEEIKNIINMYDEKLQLQNAEMENLINECEEKLKKAKIAKKQMSEKDSKEDTPTSDSAYKVGEREAKVEEREGKVKAREDKVGERESKIRTRENKVEERESKVKVREDKVEERESKVKVREGKVEEREGKVKAREDKVTEKEVHAVEKEAHLIEKEANIMEREIELKEKEDKIKKSQDELNEKSNILNNTKLDRPNNVTFQGNKNESNSEGGANERTGEENISDKNSNIEVEEKKERKKKKKEKSKNGKKGEKNNKDELLTLELLEEKYLNIQNELIEGKTNHCIYLKSLIKTLDEIIEMLNAKQSTTLDSQTVDTPTLNTTLINDTTITDAINTINYAISSWNIFGDTSATNPIENDQTLGEDINSISNFDEKSSEDLKNVVTEKLQLIKQMIG